MVDEEQIETMIEFCLECLQENPHGFSQWEQGFLESIEDMNDAFHLSEAQRSKLQEIYDSHS